MKSTTALILSLAIAGCATTESSGPWVKVHPIYQYRGYGEYLPERDAKVLEQAKAGATAAASVKFLQETLPEGIEMTGQTMGVKEGYHHELIGKLAYSEGTLVNKLELIARVKQVAAAAGGDAAIGLFLATDEKDYTKAQGVEAVIIKLDPRMQKPAPEKKPAPTANQI
jgi:hypothetical protein